MNESRVIVPCMNAAICNGMLTVHATTLVNERHGVRLPDDLLTDQTCECVLSVDDVDHCVEAATAARGDKRVASPIAYWIDQP